jgi:hypothetical protein
VGEVVEQIFDPCSCFCRRLEGPGVVRCRPFDRTRLRYSVSVRVALISGDHND